MEMEFSLLSWDVDIRERDGGFVAGTVLGGGGGEEETGWRVTTLVYAAATSGTATPTSATCGPRAANAQRRQR